MSVISKIWNALFFHPAKGWFNLPKTPASEPNPPHDNPFGAMGARVKGWLTTVTYGGRHTTPRFYVAVAVILAIITLVEVWLFSVGSLGAWLVPLLLALSAVKFFMVVGFFMHLRFDPRGYTWVFGAGLSLGVAVFIALLSLFSKLKG